MRHGKKINHLGRKTAHRKAMLSNMANSLIEHKRINTTLAKAKALRRYVEPIMTKAKTDSTHSRRLVFSELQSKEAVNELFREVAPKIASRPGGYTRIIRTGYRLGDNAEMCMIELVDFNELLLNAPDNTEKKPTTRRSKGAASTKKSDVIDEAKVVSDDVEKAPKKESKTEDATKKEPKAPKAATKEKHAATDKKEDKADDKKEDKADDKGE